MNFQTVKTAAAIPFAGVELVRVDKAITEVIIGGKLRISAAQTYDRSLNVLLATPFEEVTRHRLTATIEGFDPKVSHFETEYEANSAATHFEQKGAVTNVEPVKVLIDDSGNVVGDADGEPTASADTDLPF